MREFTFSDLDWFGGPKTDLFPKEYNLGGDQVISLAPDDDAPFGSGGHVLPLGNDHDDIPMAGWVMSSWAATGAVAGVTVTGGLFGAGSAPSAKDDQPPPKPIEVLSYSFGGLYPAPDEPMVFDVDLVAVTDGGVGLEIIYKDTSNPGEAMALLQTSFRDNDPDTFLFATSGSGGGKSQFQDLTVTVYIDKSTVPPASITDEAAGSAPPAEATVVEIDGLLVTGDQVSVAVIAFAGDPNFAELSTAIDDVLASLIPPPEGDQIF